MVFIANYGKNHVSLKAESNDRFSPSIDVFLSLEGRHIRGKRAL
jgi:hypothetical protein